MTLTIYSGGFNVSKLLSKKPKVSVVVATKNSEEYLSQCLTSIQSQTLRPLEVIVVDANSADRTAEIVREYSLARLEVQRGSGLPNAWNQGLSVASGDFIAMIDSDDYWEPEFLRSCVHALVENPKSLVALAKVKFLVTNGVTPQRMRPQLVNAELIGHMPGSTVFRRELLQEVGHFPEEFVIASDIAWFANIKSQGIESIEVPFVGLYKRMHGKNFSLNPDYACQYQAEILTIARRKLASVERDNLG